MAQAVPRFQILGAALLFSTGGAAIKACSLGSWQVASFRSGVAALVLFVAMRSWRRPWTAPTMAVGAAYAVTLVLYVSANKLTTAANTIFLQSTAPMYLLVLGPWWLGEKARRSDILSSVALAIGMALFFVGTEPPVRTAPEPFRGNLLAAAAGLSWAMTLLGLRWLGRGGDAREDRGGAAVIAGNVLAFLFCLFWALPVTGVSGSDLRIVAYLGVFQIGLAYVFLTRGVRGVPALETALILLLEPVLNAVWAWALHGERPGPWSVAGSSIILVITLLRAVIRR